MMGEDMDPDVREDEDATGPETESGRQAMAGLREIWRATGQAGNDLGLECRPDEAGCTASIGFDGFAETVEPTTNTTEAIARLRRAWKATLAREGKLYNPE